MEEMLSRRVVPDTPSSRPVQERHQRMYELRSRSLQVRCMISARDGYPRSIGSPQLREEGRLPFGWGERVLFPLDQESGYENL